jgi:hypothetical protein
VAARTKPASRSVLGNQIKVQFGDGKWHPFETILRKTGAQVKKVSSTLDVMRRWGTYKTKCERKKVGTEYHFRLFKGSPEFLPHGGAKQGWVWSTSLFPR